MLKTRILTAAIGIPLILYILFQGGYPWMAFFLVIAVGALYEYYGMLKHKGIPIMWLPGYALLLLLWASPLFGSESWLWAGLLATLLLVVAYAVLLYPKMSLPELSMNIFGPLYLGVSLHFSLRILAMAEPFKVILLVFLLTWASDIGAYAVGKLWGQRKLAPHLSPHKTQEGALGSLLFCLFTAVAFAHFIEIGPLTYAYPVIIGLTASIAAQLGDLFMSSLKRFCEVKDSGAIIPGHGGILDRFDSLLLVMPVVYYGVCCVV